MAYFTPHRQSPLTIYCKCTTVKSLSGNAGAIEFHKPRKSLESDANQRATIMKITELESGRSQGLNHTNSRKETGSITGQNYRYSRARRLMLFPIPYPGFASALSAEARGRQLSFRLLQSHFSLSAEQGSPAKPPRRDQASPFSVGAHLGPEATTEGMLLGRCGAKRADNCGSIFRLPVDR